jgi:hypothetical protein
MNYLKINLDNSLILPYDIMRIIYEYANTLGDIRRQIENKEYDLDDIMYKRMKHRIKNNYLSINQPYFISFYSCNNVDSIIINHDNIDDVNLKHALLNYNSGYKDFYLWKHKKLQTICGLEIQNVSRSNPNYDCYLMFLEYEMKKQITLNNFDELLYNDCNIIYKGDIVEHKINVYKIWTNL